MCTELCLACLPTPRTQSKILRPKHCASNPQVLWFTLPPPPPLLLLLLLQIQMQCFYLQERVHRPLNIMCGTWNMGNAVRVRGALQARTYTATQTCCTHLRCGLPVLERRS